MTAPDVSVILVSWNTRALTLACLDSLPESAAGLRYEVIVVDNGSGDGSHDALARRRDIRLIANPDNRGYAAAVNQAYAEARGEFVLLLNSDVRLRPGALLTLAGFLRERPEAAAVGPSYVNPNGSPQPHHYRLPTFATVLAIATGLRLLPPLRRRLRRHRMLDDDFSRPRPVEQLSASCLLLRRSSCPAPLFDERFPIFFNDVDLARSLDRAGHQLWMTPEAVAVHELGASTRLLPRDALARQHLGALVRYVAATEPSHRLLALRMLLVPDRLFRRALRLPGSLGLRDLWGALGGDPGPLPQPHGDTWVIYLSAIPWTTRAHRQHELARQAAQTRRVLFLEPPGLLPSWRLRVERLSPSLWRAAPPTLLPLGRFVPVANWLNRRFAMWTIRRWLDARPGRRLLWIDEDLAAPAIGRLRESAVVYDCVDLDWTFTRRWNRGHLRRSLADAVEAADLVLASSPELAASLPAKVERPVLLLNACDAEHFRPDGPQSEALAGIPRPRVGYVGGIDARAFDAPFVAELARARPRWSFVLAGPATDDARSVLGGLPNIALLGHVSYDDIPALQRGFDICIIPYRTSGDASYRQPKKLYEYLAAGKAVVSTPIPALRTVDASVRCAETVGGFLGEIEAALSADGAGPRAKRRRQALRNTWDARGQQLRDLLDNLERTIA